MSGLIHLFGWFTPGYVVEGGVVLLLVLLLVFLLPLIVQTMRKHWRIYQAFSTVPCDPEMHFIFGHALKIARNTGAAFDWIKDLASSHGWKSLKISYGPTLNMFVCVHPDTASVMLRSDPKLDVIYYPFVPWLGEGLLVANGARWLRSRRLLTPAFRFDILKPYLKVYAESADTLVELWSKVPEGQSFDASPYITLFALDVMLRCTCSFESNCQITKTHSPYIAAVYQLSDLAIKRMFFFPAYYNWIYMLTPNYWRFRRACQTVHKFSLEVIRKRRADLEEQKRKGEDVLNGRKRKYLDFIDMLLEAKDNKGVGLTDQEIRAEVDTFMFEGHDTTASSITWMLYNLAKHPEHQEKCRQEVDAIFDQKKVLEWEDLKSLSYLKCCIKESLRLFPPVAAVGRTLAQPTEIDGHMMPANTPVLCCIYAIHRNPDVWENPDEFNPLRFTLENSKNRSSYAFIPFSAGPRNCIGQEFALNEEKVALAHILRRFEVSLDEDQGEVEKDPLATLKPKSGLYLRLKHRRL